MQLIKFSADWCNPCRVVAANLKVVNLNGFSLVEVDIDKDMEMAQAHNVRGVPTLVVKDVNGKELGRKVGQLSAPQIEQWLSTFK